MATEGVLRIDKSGLRALYEGENISCAELRYLTRARPNKLISILTNEFMKQLDILKSGTLKRVALRGFLHQPPQELLRKFNSIHYKLKVNIGEYRIVILSASPFQLAHAIPVVLPDNLISVRGTYSKAQFAEIEGKLFDLLIFGINDNSRFLIAEDLKLHSYDELYSCTSPDINFNDIRDMFMRRFGFAYKDVANSALFYLFSSPLYEGRLGGNALTLVTTTERNYKCDLHTINMLVDNIAKIIPPHFTKRGIKSTFIYDKIYSTDLKFMPSALDYKFNLSLELSKHFLVTRKPTTRKHEVIERNISTIPFEISATKMLNSTYQSVLSTTDIPIPLIKDEISINEGERELYEYSFDIMHYIYLTHLQLANIQIPDKLMISAIDKILSSLSKDWVELTELMSRGKLFGIGFIGGVGEHLARITAAIMRATGKNIEESLALSEKLYSELLNRFGDVLDKPIKLLYAEIEEEEEEFRARLGSRTETAIKTVMLDLEAKYPDGWAYSLFETELRRRANISKARIQKLFDDLLQAQWIFEKTPGLFKQVWV
jgi:hypothetical protein